MSGPGAPAASVTQAAARAAAVAYGLSPRLLAPVPSVYRAVAAYRAGDVLLKPFRYGERQLYYATGALRHLADRRCPHVPRLIYTTDGEPYIRLDGKLWYATTWIEGRGPHFPDELSEATRALAAFHRAARGYFTPYGASRSWPNRWRQLLDDLLAFRQEAAAGTSPFDRLYARAAPAFIERTGACLADLAQSEYARLEAELKAQPSFCHRDCTAVNLIRARTGAMLFIDLDTAGSEFRLHDIVRMLLSAPPDARTALGALEAYETIFPLDPAERALLPAAYALPREFWWAGLCQYRQPRHGVDPQQKLQDALTGAPARDACAQLLRSALKRSAMK